MRRGRRQDRSQVGGKSGEEGREDRREVAIAVLCAKREPHTEGLRKQCEVIAGPPHMTQDFAAKCTSYCFLTGLVGGAVIVPALPPVWWGRGYISE